MFSRQRVSRGPEQPTSSNALAAASAIGRALDSNGKTVDRTRLPEYNGAPVSSRPSSVVVSRRNSMMSNMSSGSRKGSLTRGSTPSIEDIRKRTSVGSYIGAKNGSGRSYSFQYSRGPSSRNNSLTNRAQGQSADPKATFQEFGGQQAVGIIHKPLSDGPKMIKKYIPTSHGLVAVDVPIEEIEHQQRKASSLRRSSSTNSLSLSRNSSLVRRSAPQPHQPNRRHSSLTSHSGTSSKSRQATDRSLIQTYVEEETEQELSQDVVRPMRIPQDKLSEKITKVFGAAPDGKREEREPTTETEKEPAQVAPVTQADVSTKVENTTPSPAEEIAGNEGGTKNEEGTKSEEKTQNPTISVEEKTEVIIHTDEPALVKQMTSSKDEGSDDEMVDASDIVESEITKTPTKSTDLPAPSLAQHLRAVNPYLNQRDTDDTQELSTDDNKNLFKVPSPMKSALKKTNTQSSESSSMYSAKSPANQAYLSLTTAENTRLNAQLSSSETSVHRQNSKHLSRPQSMANPRSASPSPREKARTKRLSNAPKQPPASKSAQVKSPEQTPAVAAARTSNMVNRSRQDSVKRKAQEQVKTIVQANSGSKQLPDSILYPKEPPQKRSSFEKTRNQDSGLGFKKLSLRDELARETPPDTSNIRQHSSHDSSHNFLQNSGWKSRFHDSDSEEENAPFSTGTSRSTQPTSVGTNGDTAGGSFALFKGKSKPHTVTNLAPPQPAFVEQEAVSANSTPSKVNKKWSKLSLRSSSTSDTPRAETGQTSTPEKRYHSNSKLEGFSYDTMRAAEPQEADPGKKKNKFGKKLKKLFGRS